jgi:hypothetical protein
MLIVNNVVYVSVKFAIKGVVHEFYVDKIRYDLGERVPLIEFEELWGRGQVFTQKS